MANDMLIFGGDKLNLQAELEDSFDDNVEGDDFDDELTPDDPDDDKFRLEGYATLGVEQKDDEAAEADDSEFEDTITGRKRKRAKVTTIPNRSVFREGTDDGDTFMLDNGNDAANKPSSHVPGNWGRIDRKKGDSMPAYHKRVSHELDGDDELMLNMRDLGFSDKAIAERLRSEGRARYDPKSISTRIMRIREAQAKNVDFLLKEGYKEWEFEDDHLLMQAHALADIEINYEVERIRAWRFRKTSEYMRRLSKNALFSPTACRERFNTLIEGTARIPIDMDNDPEAERFKMESYRQMREDARNKEQATKEIKDATERKDKDVAKTRNAQKAAETAAKRQKKEEEKATRAMQRAAASQVRLTRATDNAAAKKKRNERIQKEKMEKEKKLVKGRGKGSNSQQPNKTPDNTTDEARDPRSYISLTDLTLMSANRGLPGLGRTKEQLISGLQDADDEYSFGDLKKMCQAKGLDTSGDKAQLKYQLALAAAKSCSSFGAGVDVARAAGEEVAVDESE